MGGKANAFVELAINAHYNTCCPQITNTQLVYSTYMQMTGDGYHGQLKFNIPMAQPISAGSICHAGTQFVAVFLTCKLLGLQAV